VILATLSDVLGLDTRKLVCCADNPIVDVRGPWVDIRFVMIQGAGTTIAENIYSL
jgi:hypothetical protein